MVEQVGTDRCTAMSQSGGSAPGGVSKVWRAPEEDDALLWQVSVSSPDDGGDCSTEKSPSNIADEQDFSTKRDEASMPH